VCEARSTSRWASGRCRYQTIEVSQSQPIWVRPARRRTPAISAYPDRCMWPHAPSDLGNFRRLFASCTYLSCGARAAEIEVGQTNVAPEDTRKWKCLMDESGAAISLRDAITRAIAERWCSRSCPMRRSSPISLKQRDGVGVTIPEIGIADFWSEGRASA